MVRSSNSGIYLGDIDSKQTARLMDASSSATYAKGHLLFSRGGLLMAQRFDVKAARLTGQAFVVASGVGAHPLRNAGIFSATAEGNLMFQQTTGTEAVRQLTFVDRQGFQHGEARYQNTYVNFSMSPTDIMQPFNCLPAAIPQKCG